MFATTAAVQMGLAYKFDTDFLNWHDDFFILFLCVPAVGNVGSMGENK